MAARAWLAVVLACSCLLAAGLRPCDPSKDLQGFYTPCNYEINQRTMIWHWALDCDSTGLETPERVFGLPCDIFCEAGQYLPYGTVTCEDCAPGYYSVDGGVRVSYWDKWPKEAGMTWKTYCGPENDPSMISDVCPGWRLNTTFIESGNLRDIHSVSSVLQVDVAFVKNGYVRFRYTCDSEMFKDGLSVQLDGRTPVRLSNSVTPRSVKAYLTAGNHRLRWIYSKNDQISSGEDKAKIFMIEISGNRQVDDFCTPCSPGTFAGSYGQSECQDCPLDTFAADFGQPECTPCPEGYYSFSGQSSCTPRTRACTSDDYMSRYTNCTEVRPGVYQRSKIYQWVQPKTCNDGELELPENEYNLTCSACQPGYVMNSASKCERCPYGSASDGEHQCQSCEAGSAAIPEVRYNSWSTVPGEVTTGCSGDCATPGWILYSPLYIFTGRNTGRQAELYLQLTAEVGIGSWIEFHYALKGGVKHSSLQLYIDNEKIATLQDSDEEAHIYTASLKEGVRQITWIYRKYDFSNEQPEAAAYLYSVTIYGHKNGSASQCWMCPPGYYQAMPTMSECYPCLYGTYAPNEGTKVCSQCSVGTYTDEMASTECHKCAAGSTSSPGARECTTTCVFSDGSLTYSLADLKGTTQYATDGRYEFLLGICDRIIGSTCSDRPNVCESLIDPKDPVPISYDAGHRMEFIPWHNASGFTLEYTGGSAALCDPGRARYSTVHFVCSEVPAKDIEYVRDDQDRCHHEFRFTTPLACPLCADSDWIEVEGSCKRGSRITEYRKREGITCNGEAPKSKQSSCGLFWLWVSLVIVIFALLVLCAIAAIVLCVVYAIRHAKLNNDYQELRSKTNEMSVSNKIEQGQESL